MEQADELPDAAFRKGDAGAFEKLFREYYEPLCRYAFSFLNDGQEAEDVVQGVFVSLWEKRADYAVETNFKGYVYRMTRNTCLNRMKHLKVVRAHVDGNPGSRITHAESASSQLTAHELETRIRQGIDALPEQCRVVFELSRFENLKYAEIAARLEISVKTVENQMGKALRIMREQLKDFLPAIVVFLLLK